MPYYLHIFTSVTMHRQPPFNLSLNQKLRVNLNVYQLTGISWQCSHIALKVSMLTNLGALKISNWYLLDNWFMFKNSFVLLIYGKPLLAVLRTALSLKSLKNSSPCENFKSVQVIGHSENHG